MQSDRARFEAVAASLRAIETDEEPSSEGMARAIGDASAFRIEHEIPALADPSELPEEEFYRRARALGFRRIRR